MKQSILLVLAIFAFSAAQAQLALDQVVNEVVGSTSVAEDNELTAEWLVINTSDATVRLRARREIISTVSPMNIPYQIGAEGARERFCWGELCFDYGTGITPDIESLLVTIEPGESDNTFKGLYEHMGVEGVSRFRYCFFDVDDESIEICREVAYCVDAAECVVGVAERAEPSLGNMGPNPVLGQAAFNFDFGASAGTVQRSVVIYNMVGSIVKEITVNGSVGTIFINGQEFEAGIYFYAMLENGTPVATRKFVVAN